MANYLPRGLPPEYRDDTPAARAERRQIAAEVLVEWARRIGEALDEARAAERPLCQDCPARPWGKNHDHRG